MHANLMAAAMFGGWIDMLSLAFLVGALFYLFRLLSPSYLKRVNGYYDWENEFWHGACLLGMVACLTPHWLPLPDAVWLVAFSVGTIWYLLRAFTYGRRLTYNKQWYDLAHAAMLFGMLWMFFQPLQHWLVTVVFAAYWLWFGSYYVYRLSLDFKKPSWLGFGQDGAHLGMALVMLMMTVWPSAFQSHTRHQAGAAVIEETGITAAGVTVIGDNQFQSEVVNHKGTVVVLVSGGCEKCATEIPVYEQVAGSLSGKGHFVRLHKDAAPQACQFLSASQCPTILIVRDGKVIARLDGFAEHEEMEQFLNKYLRD